MVLCRQVELSTTNLYINFTGKGTVCQVDIEGDPVNKGRFGFEARSG